MNTTVYKTEPVALKAWVEKRMIYLELTDGRILGFPADRFRILSQTSENQLNLTIMKSLSSPRKMKDTVREAVGRGRSNF